MSRRVLISNREGLVLQNAECNANLQHFIFAGLLLQVVFILFVKGQGLLDVCGNFYPKLVGLLLNTGVTYCNDPVSLFEITQDLPSKGWFVIQPQHCDVLCYLNGV